jgi:flagellar FliL protein
MENKKEEKGGKKLKLIIIGLLAIIIVGAGAYFGYTKFIKDKGTTTAVKTTQTQVQQTGQTQVQQTAQNQTYLQQIVSDSNFGLDECLINLADEDGKRYLKAKVFVGYDKNSKLDTELADKKPMIRDSVITVLRSKKAAEITPKGMDAIKMELIQRINPLLKKGQINNIYFSDILVQ